MLPDHDHEEEEQEVDLNHTGRTYRGEGDESLPLDEYLETTSESSGDLLRRFPSRSEEHDSDDGHDSSNNVSSKEKKKNRRGGIRTKRF